MIKNIDYRKQARERDCMIRAPGCNHNTQTTVLAHLNGGGMGTKRHDIHGAWSCSHCHDLVDGRISADISVSMRRLYLLEGIIRTQDALIAEGKL